jgi:hypothetical protein
VGYFCGSGFNRRIDPILKNIGSKQRAGKLKDSRIAGKLEYNSSVGSEALFHVRVKKLEENERLARERNYQEKVGMWYVSC